MNVNPSQPAGKFSGTIREAVAHYGISRSNIYRAIGEGKIRPRKLGKRTILIFEEMDALVRSLPAMEVRHDG